MGHPSITHASSRSGLRQARFALGQLALAALTVGVLASFAPRTFYDSFPFLTDWVDLLPPYNAHLTTDVGGLQLAFGALFAYATVRPSRELAVPVCAAWSLSQVLHLVFHVTHLGRFGTGDAIAQTVTLVLAGVVLPVLAVVALRRSAGEGEIVQPRR